MKILVLLGLVACAASPSPPDVVGPFTGTPRRFVVDTIALPTTAAAALADADDLDGDGANDNGLAGALDLLGINHDVSTHVGDMIASGAIASTIDIQADDLTNDPTVAVTYTGVGGDLASLVGGTLVDGSFRSNRSRDTRVPGAARVHLPVFADADPVVIPAYGLEIDLDSDGRGGFDGVVRGGLDSTKTLVAAQLGITQMLVANPLDHIALFETLDKDRDGVVSEDEIATSPFITAPLMPDIELFTEDNASYAPTPHGHPDSLSFGFRIHITPCVDGVCPTSPVVDACHDRVLDGDETAVDCGGHCQPCAGGDVCSIDADCQSQTCTAGVCDRTSCVDGVQDGLENQVDCGWSCPCANGQSCSLDADCLSHHCPSDGKCAP
ncbi:MAG TPA: hypothetical protein VGO00_14670 [Kofleriaceae bacterium]|nr:hypothetical protein [Kofleriaceae bacterium]